MFIRFLFISIALVWINGEQISTCAECEVDMNEFMNIKELKTLNTEQIHGLMLLGCEATENKTRIECENEYSMEQLTGILKAIGEKKNAVEICQEVRHCK
ncbi:unnamed protein product, partial [Mesorhabditis belari]|uniref:Saposin B-type domain-containing protein n=1 Tax=Mesorhabditis belari TaxID=2138241 RepID=A0AAF3ELP8_9BILA